MKIIHTFNLIYYVVFLYFDLRALGFAFPKKKIKKYSKNLEFDLKIPITNC